MTADLATRGHSRDSLVPLPGLIPDEREAQR
jgi:hypothetical protein